MAEATSSTSPEKDLSIWVEPQRHIDDSYPLLSGTWVTPRNAHLKRPHLVITPHPDAPLFTRDSNPRLIVQQLIDEVRGGNFPTNEKMRAYLRQAALVNMFFHANVVAGFNGPYRNMTDHLHLDMCNFYQTQSRMLGRKYAVFEPRFHGKSTVFVHHSTEWDISRGDVESIGICSAISNRAEEFLDFVKDVFEKNPFFAWLFPEVRKPSLREGKWNATEIEVNGVRVITFAIGGSVQGIHVASLKIDDPVGEEQLNADRQANADMYRIRNWIKSNQRTLVKDWDRSTVLYVGTRYGTDDPGEDICQNIAKRYGCWDDLPYGERDDGEWHVYYRMVAERDRIVYPEKVSKKKLMQLLREDWWTGATQFFNSPHLAGSNELAGYRLEPCYLDTDDEGNFVLSWTDLTSGHPETRECYLADCDIIVATDPAGTEKRISSKTSRTAVVVYVRTYHDTRHIINLRVGYMKTTKMMDHMFSFFGTYSPRKSVLETQGPFRLLRGLMDDEQAKREKWIHLAPQSAVGDKDANIRTTLQPLFEKGLIYCVPTAIDNVMQEVRMFPNSRKKDILDAITLAEKASVCPESPEVIEEEEEREEMMALGRNRVTGY